MINELPGIMLIFKAGKTYPKGTIIPLPCVARKIAFSSVSGTVPNFVELKSGATIIEYPNGIDRLTLTKEYKPSGTGDASVNIIVLESGTSEHIDRINVVEMEVQL